jgi:hypothetical protein
MPNIPWPYWTKCFDNLKKPYLTVCECYHFGSIKLNSCWQKVLFTLLELELCLVRDD